MNKPQSNTESNQVPENDLRQTLLELHYGLLDQDATSELRRRIETDPDVATLWAQTLRDAGQFAEAAKMEIPKLPPPRWSLSQPNRNDVSTSVAKHPTQPLAPEPTQPTKHRSVWATPTWIAAVAAGLAMMVLTADYFGSIPQPPRAAVYVQADLRSSKQSLGTSELVVRTTRRGETSIASMPVVPASLSFSVLARGTVLFSGNEQTDASGQGRITLPPELVIPPDATLRLTAAARDQGLASSTITVPLEPTRCLTGLTIDRPVYRPGETVFFRSLTLTRQTFRPDVTAPIRYELLGPDGATVAGAAIEGVTQRGVGNGSFPLPKSAPGGTYTLVAKSMDGFFPDETREFQVREYRVPRFRKEIQFDARSYGPGDPVVAQVNVRTADGSPANQVTLRVAAKVDDETVFQKTTQTTPTGVCEIKFSLPPLIQKADASLSVMVDDRATKETITKSIPIQLGRVDVDFYPEGGYLVAGLSNRVYFTARDTLGDPVSIVGEIQDRSGRQVATIETVRDGMGRFEFMPTLGQRYSLKVTSPVDVTNTPSLPSPVDDLPVMDSGDGVFASTDPITMTLRSRSPRNVRVRAVCRGQLVGEQAVALEPGDSPVSLFVTAQATGVIRVTVLDSDTVPAKPLIERLVFRRPERRLSIDVVESTEATGSLDRAPGESMRLTLRVRDEAGNPAPAMLGVSVVDEASLSLDPIDRPSLETHFWLTSETESPEDLEHADFYLTDSPEAAASLDRLLGTQGWRRFVSPSDDVPNADFRQQLVRLMQLDGSPTAEPTKVAGSSLSPAKWSLYQRKLHRAWDRFVILTRVVMLAILGLWLITIWIRLRGRRGPLAASVLLLMTSAALFPGCSSQSSTSVNVSAEKASAFESDRMPGSIRPALDAPPPQEADASNDLARQLMQASAAHISGKAFQPNPDDSLTTRTIGTEELRSILKARGLDADSMAETLIDELRFPIRQYAHRHKSTDSDVREDFAETLYWQPLLVTDSNGMASIRFDLSDSVTTFRVAIDGHSSDGRLGSGDAVVVSRLPFQIEPKMPLRVTVGDRIDLPIGVINSSSQDAEVALSIQADAGLSVTDQATQTLSVAANDQTRRYFAINVEDASVAESSLVEVRAVGESHSDAIRRQVVVNPKGYPGSRSIAGVTSKNTPVQWTVPEQIVDGSLRVNVRFYPSPLADIVSGVDSILREPHGCFEQASATNYPNTMVLDYLRKTNTENPEVRSRAMGMLDRGYQKLIPFECQQLGFEWFGSDPGHEALSAFGLMQFTDMARLMPVDASMITRTRDWLLGRRDGNGGFRRNPRHLHVWSVKQDIVNAYVLWAISEADVAAGQPQRTQRELRSELDQLTRVADQSDDAYLIALSAATLANVGREESANRLMLSLSRLQREDGGLSGQTTVTSSGGRSREMETTALAVIAWAKNPRFALQARAAVQWIAANRGGNGGFGSTQATVLALKALVATATASAPMDGGMVQVKLDGQVIGSVQMTDQIADATNIEINGLGQPIGQWIKRHGRSDCELEIVTPKGSSYSYTIETTFHTPTPQSDLQCPIEVTAQWVDQEAEGADYQVKSGEEVAIRATVTNQTDQGQPMTVAIVGLPGGIEADVNQLDQRLAAGDFAYYELRGSDVVFYWRDFEPGATKMIQFNGVAEIPGRYTGPASRGYLYYTAEQKRWSQPLRIEIVP